MNERITKRCDRQNRFGDAVRHSGMDSVKLGRRSYSQCEQLFLRIMESVHVAYQMTKKERSES